MSWPKTTRARNRPEMLHSSSEQSSIDISELSPEDRQLFVKLVDYLLEENEWMAVEEAQRYAYQQLCFRNIEYLG